MRPKDEGRLTRRSLLAGAYGALVASCAAHHHRLGGGRRAAPRKPAARAPSGAAPAPTTTRPLGGPARFVRSGPRARPAVALTFHGSGDIGLLEQLLGASQRAGAPMTVFAVGQWLDANPSVARRVLAGGHELANHTYTHPSLGRLGRAGVEEEIARGRVALLRHAGSAGLWFRPSGVEVPTAVMLAAAAEGGYRTVVGYDVDPSDYLDPGADVVVRRTTAGLHPGAIVSLHTGHPGTVAAFAPVVAAVRARGLEPVLLRDLLGPRP